MNKDITSSLSLDSIDENYKYFKLIFGNIFIRDHIFKFIKGNGGRSFDSINFRFIAEYQHYELFLYKCQIQTEFIDMNITSLFQVLKFVMEKKGVDSDYFDGVITKFYQSNKNQITRLLKMEDMFEVVTYIIGTKCGKLLELIYNDHYRGNLYNKFTVGQIQIIYNQAFTIGSISVLSVLLNELKLIIGDGYKDKLLFWSLNSSNRDEVVKYLLDKLNYTVPKSYGSGCQKNFFEYLIKLDHSLLKRLVNAGSPLQFSYIPLYIHIINYSKSLHSLEIPENYSIFESNCYVPFKKVLDFIQNSIYISILKHDLINNKKDHTDDQISIFKCFKKKIKLLIKYNGSGNEEIKNQILEIEDEINKIDNNIKNGTCNGGKGKMKFIKSVFKSSPTSSTNEINSIVPPFQNRTNVKFEQFNLEREIRRIYIFDFLIMDFQKYISPVTFAYFTINFASYFNEYSLILDFIQYEKQVIKRLVEYQKDVMKGCFRVAFQNCDVKLLVFAIDNFQNDLSILKSFTTFAILANPSDLFNCSATRIESQIEFLSTIVKLNINFPFSFQAVLRHIFTNNENNLTFQQLDQINEIIENYYVVQQSNSDGNKYLKAYSVLSTNKRISNYYQQTDEKMNYFTEWANFSKLRLFYDNQKFERDIY